MAVDLTVNVSEFADLIPKLVNATRKTLSDVVRQQARLIVRGSGEGRDEGLVPYTAPPKGQEQGKAAVARDINRVFLTAASARKIVKNAKQRGLSLAFGRAIRANDEKKMLDVLTGQSAGSFQVKGYTTKRKGKSVAVRPYTMTKPVSSLNNNALLGLRSVANEPDASIHKRRRGSYYQVRRERYSQLVLQTGSLAEYIKKVQRNVGTMKAGWRPAAEALGVTLPTFVKNAKHASGSVLLNLDSENPSVTMTNNTPGIRRSLKSLLERTLRGRRMRMEADIQRKLAAELAKAAA